MSLFLVQLQAFILKVYQKNVIHPSQVFYKKIAYICRAPIFGQPLNGCLPQSSVEVSIKNQCSVIPAT